jgi:hypothetical protein
MAKATAGMPEPGDAWAFQNGKADDVYPMPKEGTGPLEPDTSYLCVVDSEGNAFSSTPGDGARETPFVPGFGFIISSVLGSIFTHTSRTRSSILTGRRPSLPRCCARTSTSARGRARPRRADAADRRGPRGTAGPLRRRTAQARPEAYLQADFAALLETVALGAGLELAAE